jgi:hypothetical protein
MFSKRHYEFLADFYGSELRSLTSIDQSAVERMAASLARRLREDNPRFDTVSFLAHVHAVANGGKVVTQ